MVPELIKNFPRRHPAITVILMGLAFLKVTRYTPQPVYWDSATYILIGKYLFSFGHAGFSEPFRPIAWPVLLGAGWKLGLDPIAWGKVLQGIFSLGNVLLVYLIGSQVYDKRTGSLAALFTALSPTLFFWGNTILTGIPATFFGLLAVYFYIRDRHCASGISAAFAFLTKFTQIIPLALLSLTVCVANIRRQRFRIGSDLIRFAVGSGVLIAVYLLANLGLYGNMLKPFTDAAGIYTRVPHSWASGIVYCLSVIVKIDSWILLFVPISLIMSVRPNMGRGKFLLTFIGLLQFVWVGKLPTDLPRLFISCLPYLYILSADGVVRIYDILKRNIAFCGHVLMIAVLIYAGVELYRLTNIGFPDLVLRVEQQYVQAKKGEMSGKVIWISDPRALVYADLRADERMYYPAFTVEKAQDLRARFNEPDYIFIDSKDLRCRPVDSAACQAAKGELINAIRQRFKEEFYYEIPADHRSMGIFKRKE